MGGDPLEGDAPRPIPLAGAQLLFYPWLLGEDEAPAQLGQLIEQTAWRQESITLFGKTHLQPRLIAWYGDPAFDLAFCLNHLLLKCLWVPDAAGKFLACFHGLAEAYLSGVDWEDRGDLQARAAHLLPGLLLAREDGKSPVEYLTDEDDKAIVRRVATRLLEQPAERLGQVAAAWSSELTP